MFLPPMGWKRSGYMLPDRGSIVNNIGLFSALLATSLELIFTVDEETILLNLC